MKTKTLNQIFSLVFLGFILIFNTSIGNATEINTDFSVNELNSFQQNSNFSVDQFDEDQETYDNVGTLNVMLYTKAAYEAGATSSDAFVIHFTRDGSNEIDNRDAPKMMNFDENLARLEQGEILVVENRAIPTPNETMQLFINQFTTTEYVLKFITPDFEGLKLNLVDDYTKEVVEVESGSTSAIYFTISDVNASQAYNRFSLEFEQVTLSTSNYLEQNKLMVYPNPVISNSLTLQVSNNLSGNVQVEIFNLQGKRVYLQLFKNQTTNTVKIENLNFKDGVYYVKITGDSNLSLTKKIIKS